MVDHTDGAASVASLLADAVSCRERGDLDGAAAAASRALALSPSSVEALSLAAWVACQQGEADAALAYYRDLVRLAPANPRWPFESARLLTYVGRIADGDRALGEALRRWPNDLRIRDFAARYGFDLPPLPAGRSPSRVEREFRALREQAPSDAELRRPVIVDEHANDCMVAAMPGSSTAVLVFTGLSDAVAMPIPTFDRHLAALGVTAIYLKDFHRLWYRKGVISLGGDEIASVAALRGLLGELGVRRLIALGTSAGGTGAIRYGMQLGAARILCFSAATHWQNAPPEGFEYALALARKRFVADFPSAAMDLKPFLASRPAANIDLFYAEGVARDKEQALYLENVPGVTLHGVDAQAHEILRLLALDGRIGAILRGAVAGDAP